MDRYKVMKVISQFLFAIVVILCVFVLLLNFNIISLNSSDLPLALSLNQNEVGVKVGDDYQLEATVVPSDVYYGRIEWSSSDKSIATVNKSTGYVETHKVGDVTITAKVAMNDLVASCVVHVLEKDVLVNKIQISNEKINLAVGKSYSIRYKVSPTNATTHNFSFTSSDSSVVVVNEKGVIKAISEGTAIITMKSKLTTAKDTVVVNVYRYSNSSNAGGSSNQGNNGTYTDTDTYYKTKSLTLSKKSLELVKGAQTQLSATIAPSNANQEVNWSSSDSSIVTVNSNGVVTAVKAGTANIIATSIDGVSDVCKIVIKNKDNNTAVTPTTKPGINISDSVLKIEVGKTKKVNINFYLVDSSKTGVEWSSSNRDIATVEDGVISAKSTGTCIIKAISSDGKYSDYVTVTVTPAKNVIALQSISFSQTSYNASVNDTITLKPTITPSDATYRFLTWTTSNRNIAVVENGIVRCVGEGRVTITATSGNVSSSVTITISKVNPNSITIENGNANGITLSVNKTMYLIKKIIPSNSTNQSVTWTSSDSSIVSVNGSGMIKGIKAGTATITVKTVNNKTATVKVIVS